MSDNEEANLKTAAPLPEIPNKDAGKIWMIVIWTLAIILVISVIVLGLSVFITPAKGGTSGQTILTVITTVIAFLAGLFAPSPVDKKKL
jgi:hypothetical protein